VLRRVHGYSMTICTLPSPGATPDVIFVCGSGTSWDDEKLICEDSFGAADFVDLVDLKLVLPDRPKAFILPHSV